MINPQPIFIQFNDKFEYTQNLFEDNEVLRQATLHLFEENSSGDCMCLVNGKYLVDIDHRDIKKKTVIPIMAPGDIVDSMINTMVKVMQKPKHEEGFCDGCHELFPDEAQQDFLKAMSHHAPNHVCALTQEQLKHNGQHPRIPKPTNCPLAKKV